MTSSRTASTSPPGYDRRIIVERAVEDNIEINCSVLGYGAEVRASVCERPVSWKKF